MAETKGRFWRWLLPKLFIFALGVAAGWYVKDRQANELQRAYEQARTELRELREAGADVIERGRRAGESLREGAKAAADSTKAAVEEMKGGGEEN